LPREYDNGFYTVVGRIKEIIITAGGENIAPTNIEEEIKLELGEVREMCIYVPYLCQI
jgi:long-subunit acyl-CoA synthetase (AMP-forming)